VIEHRLSCAVEDMRHFANFDYVIINDDFNKAVHLEAIITANRLVTLQQSSRHQKLIENLITLNRE
jgi:guanylate kinase